MGKDFTVTIIEGTERAVQFERIFGTRTVHVRSFIPRWANLPGLGEKLIYELDLDLITDDQRQRLIAYVATKFGISTAEVAVQLDTRGVSILASDTVSTITNPQKWF